MLPATSVDTAATPVVESTVDSASPVAAAVIADSVVSFPSVQLGASDIDAIVKAIVPPLASFLSKFTPEQQYVGLFTLVSKLALGKTFSNKDELASLVQDISNLVAQQVVNPDWCIGCFGGSG